ncbi:MAG: hypothetical protein ACTTKT_03750 [Prevotella veroralis]
MRKIVFIFVISALLLSCTDSRQGQLSKVLFLLNWSGHFDDYTLMKTARCSYNYDSLLAKVDTALLKRRKAVPYPLVQDLLDSLCTDSQLLTYTHHRYSPVVRLSALDALIRRKNPHVEQVLLQTYNDTSMIGVGGDDYFWEEAVGSIALRHVQQSRKKGVITLRDSLYNDSLVLSNPKFSTYSYLKELRLKQH